MEERAGMGKGVEEREKGSSAYHQFLDPQLFIITVNVFLLIVRIC